MAITLDRPVLQFAVHEDGTWERTSPWFPILVVPPALLERVDGRRLIMSAEEDLLTFRCTNGWARYRLSGPNADGERTARLLEAR